jgi:hypothetical protein
MKTASYSHAKAATLRWMTYALDLQNKHSWESSVMHFLGLQGLVDQD